MLLSPARTPTSSGMWVTLGIELSQYMPYLTATTVLNFQELCGMHKAKDAQDQPINLPTHSTPLLNWWQLQLWAVCRIWSQLCNLNWNIIIYWPVWLTSMCSASFPGEQQAAMGRAQPKATSSGGGWRTECPCMANPDPHGALERGGSQFNWRKGLYYAHLCWGLRDGRGSSLSLPRCAWLVLDGPGRCVETWGSGWELGSLASAVCAGCGDRRTPLGWGLLGQDSPCCRWNGLPVRREGGGHTGACGVRSTSALR